jgi:adenine C2-methylase RlmN of 23S rRNA A2503 and tRNA A37
MNLIKLEKILKDDNQPKFRLEQVKKAVYQNGVSSFLEISTIPIELRQKLDKESKILSFDVEKILVSEDKKSVKALLKISCHSERNGVESNNLKKYKLDPSTELGMTSYFIETVLLSPRPGVWTVCLSSQVGCPLGCAFCATGKGGFKKNLTAEEITDQVLFWKQYLNNLTPCLSGRQAALFLSRRGRLVNNIVYMGMGEPMLNLENVKQSIGDLIDPKKFAFGSRSISVSTAGIPDKLKDFWKEFPQINLAISIHFADNRMRSQYMPINNKYSLDRLRMTLKKYFQKNKRKVFLEYIMFQGLNDSLKDAEKLIDYLKSIGNVYLLHINLISYNKTSNNFKPSSKDAIIKFRNYLIQNKVNVTVRKSFGQDIFGACGQLRGL